MQELGQQQQGGEVVAVRLHPLCRGDRHDRAGWTCGRDRTDGRVERAVDLDESLPGDRRGGVCAEQMLRVETMCEVVAGAVCLGHAHQEQLPVGCALLQPHRDLGPPARRRDQRVGQLVDVSGLMPVTRVLDGAGGVDTESPVDLLEQICR